MGLGVSGWAQEISTIFAGAGHGLAISNNRLWGWGSNQPVGTIGGIATQGKEANTNLFLTYRIGGDMNWKFITGMGDSRGTTYALRTDGSLWAWGDNSLGQLGDGTGLDSKVPVQVGTNQNWKSISAVDGRVFGLQTDGTLWAWGENRLNTGGLGIGRGRDTKQYLPLRLGQGALWKSVSAGASNAWFLPDPEWKQFFPMAQVHFGLYTRVKGAGGAAVTESGQLWFWGNALSIATNFSPIRFGSEKEWSQIVFGPRPYALKRDGTLWQFIFTKASNVGPGSNAYSFSKFEAFSRIGSENATNWSRLSALSYESPSFNSHVGLTNDRGEVDVFYFTGHVLGLKQDGSLWAWGNNDKGQLGVGTTKSNPFPARVGTDTDWVEASAGPFYSLAKKADGSVWAWGAIGGQADPYVRVPTRVGADYDWLTAVAGSDYSLAIKTDGRIFACGNTALGGEGDTNAAGATTQTNFAPILTGGANRTDSIWSETGWTGGVAAYRRKMLAIETNGNLRIWGDAFGDYPGDDRTNLAVPIPVDLDTTRPWWDPERYEPGVLDLDGPWISITGNSGTADEGYRTNGNTLPAGFAVAVRGDGTLWAWGANDKSQLGDGTRVPKDLPVRIGAGSNWLRVEAGGGHVLALQKDGSVWAWGANDKGQLGAKKTNLVATYYDTNIVNVVTNRTYDIRYAPVRVITNLVTNVRVTPYTHRQVEFETNLLEPRRILETAWGAGGISAGGSHSLILKSDGTLWELPPRGAPLGSSNTTGAPTFPTVTKIITNIDVAPVRIESNTFHLSITVDRTLNKTIANVTSNGWRWKALPASFAAGDRHNLAIRADGVLCSWGDNRSAQLGNGGLTGTNHPTVVGAGNRWSKVFAGKEHSLAIKNDGSLWAWGLNDGRLGLPSAVVQSFYEPTALHFGLAGLARISFENGKSGPQRISGSGLAAFLPSYSNADFSVQLVDGLLDRGRLPWEGKGIYSFRGKQLRFSTNTYLSFLETNSTDVFTRTNSIPESAFVRLEWRLLEQSTTNPALYEGEAKYVRVDPVPSVPNAYENLRNKNGTACRVRFLFDQDGDSDGIPDMADGLQGVPPEITSPSRVNLNVGSASGLPYRVTLASDGNRESTEILANKDLSELPDGLVYTADGFAGSPTENAVGQWEVVVGAKNSAGEAYQTVVVNVPPVITSGQTLVWTQGSAPFEYQITATPNNSDKFPITYAAANLPAGLSINPTSGWIRPTQNGQTYVPAPGLYRWSLVASNAGGATTNAVEVRVAPPGSGEWTAGSPLAYAINLAPGATYAINGLPPGLFFNVSRGLITGAPLAAGVHEVEVVSRTRSATQTNRISLPVRLGRPEIVGSSRLMFTGAASLRQNRFFRYQISARSAGQPWAGASDFTEALAKQWIHPTGSYGDWRATGGTLRYHWTNTNAATASLDWSQPLPLDTAWQVSVNAAFSTNNLSGFFQGDQHLTAMLVALRDRSSNSAASNFISVYLEGAAQAPSGMVVGEAVVDGLPNGAVAEEAMEGRSALSFVYRPISREILARGDGGDESGGWRDFQSNSLTTWAQQPGSNSVILRLMGQSQAVPYPGIFAYLSRFVVVPVGNLSYSSSNLPKGLKLDSQTGLIYGTPTTLTNNQDSTVVISNNNGFTNLLIKFSIR